MSHSRQMPSACSSSCAPSMPIRFRVHSVARKTFKLPLSQEEIQSLLKFLPLLLRSLTFPKWKSLHRWISMSSSSSWVRKEEMCANHPSSLHVLPLRSPTGRIILPSKIHNKIAFYIVVILYIKTVIFFVEDDK